MTLRQELAALRAEVAGLRAANAAIIPRIAHNSVARK